MSENYRKTVPIYSQFCMPKQTPDKTHTVYRPFSLRKVSATKELNRLADTIKTLEAKLEKIAELPIKIQANADGQVWIAFDAGKGRQAMVSLNNIVLEMNKKGINRDICMDALSAILEDKS